jgi:hypothetical protein
MKSTNTKSLAGISMLILLAASVVASEDPLGPSNTDAVQDIRETIQQEQKDNATQEKNLPGSVASTRSSQPRARLLSPISTWSLNLLDSKERAVTLEMHQSNDVVFGKGTINAGGSLQNATAIGTITGNKLNLDVLSDDLTLFRLYLTMNGKSLSGDYHGYSVSYESWKGIAMGSIEA